MNTIHDTREDKGYDGHTGFGGLIGQQGARAGFANAATAVEAETARDAITLAGLDWTVSKRPLWFTGKSNGSKPKKIEGSFAMVKDDDEQYLGTVGKQYHGIQNIEAFEWADSVPGRYIAGGAMRTNRQVYLIKELETGVVAGNDETTMYLLLRSSHDGTKALQAMATPVRIRCMNMLPLANRRSTFKFSVRHVTTFSDKLEEAARVHKLVKTYTDEYRSIADTLATTSIDQFEFKRLIEQVMPGRVELRDGILQNLALSNTIDDAQRETAWGALNAATEYLEWKREVKSPTHALQANIDGQGARFRQGITQRLLAFAANN